MLGRLKALWSKESAARASAENNQADAMKAQGDACLGQGDLETAVQWYDKAVDADPRHLPSLIQLGFCLRQLGRLDQAEQVLQQALVVAPDSADAHYLLAGVAQARGQGAQAIEGLLKVLACDVEFEPAYPELCFLLFQAGRTEDAKQMALSGLARFTQSAELQFSLGNIHHAENNGEQAVACFRQAVALAPAHAFAWANLSNVLQEQGQIDAALDAIDQALALMPNMADWYVKRGYILQLQERLEPAFEAFQRAITLQPELARAHSNLAILYERKGQPELAVASHRQSVELARHDAEMLFNLGACLSAQGRFDEAMVAYKEVLRLAPNHGKALVNGAAALAGQKKIEEALAFYDLVFERCPDLAEARMNKAFLLLKLGRFAEGWPLFEYRWECEESPPRPDFGVPLWLGEEDIQGKSILLYGEQGYGDTIHFLRYAKVVAARGARVSLLLQRPLVSLGKSCPDVAEVFAEGEPLPAFDFVSPLLSLPFACKTEVNTIPGEVPYLRGAPQKIAAWGAKLDEAAPGTGIHQPLRVGIAWAGDPRKSRPHAAAMDRVRSMHFSNLLPLLDVPGVAFFSLQIGDEARLQMAGDSRVADVTKALGDFQDTASLIHNLDLVISVDTSIVHLTGALGKPVWMMDRLGHCYRWFAGREDSPWYPTLRIFRQETAGDWPGVVERVKAALTEFSRMNSDQEAGTREG